MLNGLLGRERGVKMRVSWAGAGVGHLPHPPLRMEVGVALTHPATLEPGVTLSPVSGKGRHSTCELRAGSGGGCPSVPLLRTRID